MARNANQNWLAEVIAADFKAVTRRTRTEGGGWVESPVGLPPHDCPARFPQGVRKGELVPLPAASAQQRLAITRANNMVPGINCFLWLAEEADPSAISGDVSQSMRIEAHERADENIRSAQTNIAAWEQIYTGNNLAGVTTVRRADTV